MKVPCCYDSSSIPPALLATGKAAGLHRRLELHLSPMLLLRGLSESLAKVLSESFSDLPCWPRLLSSSGSRGVCGLCGCGLQVLFCCLCSSIILQVQNTASKVHFYVSPLQQVALLSEGVPALLRSAN